MVKIDKINWLSEEAREAEVYLSDEDFNIVGFSHPFNQVVGDKVSLPLYSLNAKGIYSLNGEERFSVERTGMAFEYELSGRVINKDCNQVKVGEFIIQLDSSLPNDIEVGDYVSFACDRIDIY